MVLKAYPLEVVGNFVAVVACLIEVFNVAVGIFVIDGAIAFFKHFALFLASHALSPVDVEVRNVLRNHTLHVLLEYLHLDHIAALSESVANAPLNIVAEVELHSYSRVILSDRSEVEVASVVALSIGVEHKSERIGILVEKRHVRALVGVVFKKRSIADGSTLGGDVDF